MKTLLTFCVISSLPFAAAMSAAETSSPSSQNIALASSLQIPGGVLSPGHYTLSVEDRLSGRAIVRIANIDNNGEHHLLLTVPNAHIAAIPENRLILFDTASKDKRILRAWSCPGCSRPLEMVYPKQDAVEITAASGQSVMAADPAYDRLPANLSADDMKVVTLWLLSPQRVAKSRGYGLKAAKWSNPPAPSSPRTLPDTASNRDAFAAAGIVFLAASFALRLRDERRKQRCPA